LDTLSIILKVLNIIGSLGLFLFGMTLMSEALQKIAGEKLRTTLSVMTSRRLKGVFAGFLFTGILQSSSVVTVLIISFVNAGMITLGESVGLIIGANIGTTVKIWLFSLLGFGGDFSINMILLPLIAVSIPLFLSSGSKIRSAGEFIIGFALLFIGLQFIRDQVPAVDPDSFFLQKILAISTNSEFVSLLIFVGLGMLLTVIFQSSSVTITLTIVLAIEQWIPFEMAAAMVLGENIGTTTTALFASIVANNSAKRAALIHLLFNIIGVIWAIALFHPILAGIHSLLSVKPSAPLSPELIPFGLAILHSGFNIANAILLTGLSGLLVKLSFIIIPSKGKKKERTHLRFINSHISSFSEISIIQAKKEVSTMAKNVQEMFGIIPLLLIEKDQMVYNKLLKRVQKLENRIDRMEEETATYLSRIAEGKLSKRGTEELQALLRCIDEIEGIGDACYKMSIVIRNKNELKLYFIQDLRDRLQELFSLVDHSLEIMDRHISGELHMIHMPDAVKAEKKINDYRDMLKEEHLASLKEEKYSHQTGIVYNELITQCEKIGDFALNVSESLATVR